MENARALFPPCVVGFVQTKEPAMAEMHEIYRCQTVNCGFVYDPDRGDKRGKIPKGTAFADLPDTWRCPVCGGTSKCFVSAAEAAAGAKAGQGEGGCELPTK